MPPHYLGVAYAVRSVIGFGMGVISPVAFGWALDLAGGGKTSGDPFAWGIAWMTLGARRAARAARHLAAASIGPLVSRRGDDRRRAARPSP